MTTRRRDAPWARRKTGGQFGGAIDVGITAYADGLARQVHIARAAIAVTTRCNQFHRAAKFGFFALVLHQQHKVI